MTTIGSGSRAVINCVEGTGVESGSCTSNTGSSCGSGSGTKTQTRTGDIEPSNGGSACSTNILPPKSCSLPPCPEPFDCEVTWGSWTCEVEGSSCGSGIQTRYGSVSEPATNGGSCGSNIEYGSSCDVDCDGSG